MLVMKSAKLITVFSIAWLAVISNAQDPCTDYIELTDDGRRSSANAFNAAQLEPRYCDSNIDVRWYRLKVNGADADMPTTAPAIGSCNAIYPVWLDGQLPTVENAPVAIRACAVGLNDCSAELSIRVTKCHAFNVYELKPWPTCPTAYCFGTKVKCPAGQTSEDGFQPGCTANFPDITPVKPVVKPLLGVSDVDASQQEIRFQCEFKTQINKPNLFYDVVWYINDEEVFRIIKQTWNSLPESAELREHHWKDSFKMGMNVKCAIRARATLHGIPSPEHEGDIFFAGLKILDIAVDMQEGEVKDIKFQATVPVPCLIHPILGLLACEMVVRFRQIGKHASGICNSDDKPSSCGISIKSNGWASVQKLEVTAERDNTYSDRLAQIYLKCTSQFLDPNRGSVWAGVEPQPVQVNIKDTTAQVAGSSCSIHNDPHFVTFDKRKFDVHLPGEFVLFRHKSLKLEVRGYFQKCSTVAHCVCGAAVRSGSQLFVWSKCKDNLVFQTTRVRLYGCQAKQMRVSVNDQKNKYEVTLPTGTKVVINVGGSYGTITINPSPADVSQTEGLCGNFNGNIDDEYIDPNGVQHSNTCERYLFGPQRPVFCMVPTYSQTWQITDPAQSYYNGQLVDTFGPPLIGHCYCATDQASPVVVDEIKCDNVPPETCGNNPGQDITDDYCTQLGATLGGRRKRAASTQAGSINDDEEIPIFPVELPPVFVQPVWINGWTQAKAEAHCLASLKGTKAFEPCQKVANVDSGPLIESCVADILLSGGSSWTATTVENFKSICISEVTRNTSYWEPASPGERPILNQVTDNACTNECSNHGACTNGICECSNPWGGPDCSIDISKPPEVLGLPFGGLCNSADRDCRQTVVYGNNFVESSQLRCSFKELEVIPYEGTVPTGRTIITGATFRHSSEVVCSLTSDVVTSRPAAFILSVANRNGIYSTEKLYVTYDESCLQCVPEGLDVICETKDGYCETNGTCVKHGETMASGQICQAATWSSWFDRDNPSGNGDNEAYSLQHPRPCGRSLPVVVQVRLVGTANIILTTDKRGKFSPREGSVTQYVDAGPTFGFNCLNKDQKGAQCKDYEVRFLCSKRKIFIKHTVGPNFVTRTTSRRPIIPQ